MGVPPAPHFQGHAQARLASPFAARQLVTRKVAAAILGVDVKTLVAMRERRIMPAVRTASGEFRFSEADIRDYLATSELSKARSEETESQAFKKG